MSELFFTMVAEHVREIAVEREHGILHERIQAEMQAFHRLSPTGDTLERAFELRQVLDLDHQMELAECRRAEAKLAPGEPPPFDQALFLEMAEVSRDLLAEF